jgi:hypothetical protein
MTASAMQRPGLALQQHHGHKMLDQESDFIDSMVESGNQEKGFRHVSVSHLSRYGNEIKFYETA